MPEFEAIVDGVTGTFFEEDNVVSLSEAIKKWLSINKDRDEIRKACYSVIDEKYNPHRQVQVMKNVIINK